MYTMEDRILNKLEPTRKLTRIEVSAKSMSNADVIISKIMDEGDVLVRQGMWELLHKTVGSRAYISIRMKAFVKYGNIE